MPLSERSVASEEVSPVIPPRAIDVLALLRRACESDPMSMPNFVPGEGGIKVVLDVADEQIDEVLAVISAHGFDARRYYPSDQMPLVGGAPEGMIRVGAERPMQFIPGEEAAIEADLEQLCREHDVAATVVSVETWEAGHSDLTPD